MQFKILLNYLELKPSVYAGILGSGIIICDYVDKVCVFSDIIFILRIPESQPLMELRAIMARLEPVISLHTGRLFNPALTTERALELRAKLRELHSTRQISIDRSIIEKLSKARCFSTLVRKLLRAAAEGLGSIYHIRNDLSRVQDTPMLYTLIKDLLLKFE